MRTVGFSTPMGTSRDGNERSHKQAPPCSAIIRVVKFFFPILKGYLVKGATDYWYYSECFMETIVRNKSMYICDCNHIAEKYLVMGVAHKALIYKSKQRKYQLPYS